MILPRGNQKDLRDLPEEVRQEMEFIFADRVEDVLQAVVPGLIWLRRSRRDANSLRWRHEDATPASLCR